MTPTPKSSWLQSLTYVRRAPNVTMPAGTDGFIVITGKDGRQWAHAVPYWMMGLVKADAVNVGSVGRAYNRMLKGKYESVRLN